MSTTRRDELLRLQKRAQDKWAACKAFEVDAPAEGEDAGEKYMVTFPYPYMNGRLHLGHAFTITKAEFSAAFHRMQGRRSLFPMGWHCTGMPICAAARKLESEYDKYGKPLPNFPTAPPSIVNVEGTSVTLEWRSPTCTGGHELTGYAVLVLERSSTVPGEWMERTQVAVREPSATLSVTLEDLTTDALASFAVETRFSDGTPGQRSKPTAELKVGKAVTKEEASAKKGKGAKSKVAAKTGGLVHQWDVMRSLGLHAEEIVPFTDPLHWLSYFPPYGRKDLTEFGAGVDFRRSFITTDANPYYDAFVRWQFNKLKAVGKIKFGKRPAIYSEVDGQPCMDHDRRTGEGAVPQEYTGIKLRILELPESMKALDGKKVFCIAATLRPETMCGQTNCWALPSGKYGAFAVNETDVFVCSHRAARNMSFQDIFPEFGKAPCVMDVPGSALIGVPLHAPLSPYERVYMLPLMSIKMNKGTGIVTSVPSDSPDDYAAFTDLKKAKKQEFYGLKPEWVDPFDLVPIIEIPDLGKCAAETMCKRLGVQGTGDTDKLHEAHEVVYTQGFYKGIMVAGDFAGKTVQEAKPLCKAKMVEAGTAMTYLEPEKEVISRSDDECVVALVDQWYLVYGEDSWRSKVKEHVNGTMDMFNPAVTIAFNETLGWLSDWACSRSFGLGTRMPWDKQFLIESLSDSTIYMAYYTISHLLQGGDITGKTVGPSGISADQCTDEFFDHVFLGGPAPPNLPADQLANMRREFLYWYPMDCRVSGKDLIQNHLTMSLYNHAAIWPDDPGMWPRGFYANGHVLVNNTKMSKSEGNFLTLKDACDKYSADATRFTCADAGDGVEDANFAHDTADAAIKKLVKELDWMKAELADAAAAEKVGRGKGSSKDVFADRWFESEMLRLAKWCKNAYERMIFRDALRFGFHEFQEARDKYRMFAPGGVLHRDLLEQFLEWQALLLAPICPHWAEAVWEMLGREGCVVRAKWPDVSADWDHDLEVQGAYLSKAVRSMRNVLDNPKLNPKGAPPRPQGKPNVARVYVAREAPRWKQLVCQIVSEHYDPETREVAPEVMKALAQVDELKPRGKLPSQLAGRLKAEAKEVGAKAFDLSAPFDEVEVLNRNMGYIQSALEVGTVVIVTDQSADLPEPKVLEVANPQEPAVVFDVVAAKVPAQEYVDKHQLAEVLNEVVNAVVLEQPADPLAFLADLLVAKAGKGRAAAPATLAAAKSPLAVTGVSGGKSGGASNSADGVSGAKASKDGVKSKGESSAAVGKRPATNANGGKAGQTLADDRAKKVKQATKEGGKKGIDIAGAADMMLGLEFYCTTIDAAEGDGELLDAAMTAANAEVDEAAEERKGGSGHIGKMLFSAGDDTLAIAAYCPADKVMKLSCADWMKAVVDVIGGEVLPGAEPTYARARAAKNEARGRFPLKLKEDGIAAAIAHLKKHALFPETNDDDDDEPCYGDDAFDNLGD